MNEQIFHQKINLVKAICLALKFPRCNSVLPEFVENVLSLKQNRINCLCNIDINVIESRML